MNHSGRLSELNCEQVRALIPELADGSLATAVSASVRTHVDSCSACHCLFATFTEVDSVLIDLGRAFERESPAPFGQGTRLARSLASAPSRKRPFNGWMAAAASVLVAASIIAGIALPHRKRGPVTRGEVRFVEIPYLAPLDPHENATVVRMDVKVATLLAAGYRVTADPDRIVPADVLVGEDGRAHAVRMVADVEISER